jgi:D-alanyl-D-alanine dipeptidase
VRASVFNALVNAVDELDKLAGAFGYKKGALRIMLFEGLRDLRTQKELFDTKQAALRAQHPDWTDEQVYAETCTWVSPYINNVPVHSTGAAVDIHLYDSDSQRYCDMGRFNTSGAHAPTFSTSNVTPEQMKHRLLLLIATKRAGLINYLNEFWHFSCGDRYASFWLEQDPAKRVALYGPAEAENK